MKMTMLHVPNRDGTFTCYLDESDTDNSGSVAVVGGLILDMGQLFWFGEEWKKILSRHSVPLLHMCEFGKNRSLGHLDSEERRSLFTDVVRVINDNKTYSVASVLTSEEYRRTFDGVSTLSMYGASFVQLGMVNGVNAQKGGYKRPINYVLDDGNAHKNDVKQAHGYFQDTDAKSPLNVGTLQFDLDHNHAALQGADVVSWTVRRRLSQGLRSGFEPLEELRQAKHLELHYKEEWMVGVAERIREKEAANQNANETH
jgi:hypothetical protein